MLDNRSKISVVTWKQTPSLQSNPKTSLNLRNFLTDYTDNIYRVYKDKLQSCSCNQFHYTGTYKQVEKNSITKNRGGNNGNEKWIEKNTAATDRLIEAVHGSYVCVGCVRWSDWPKWNSEEGGKWLEDNVLRAFVCVFLILVMKLS